VASDDSLFAINTMDMKWGRASSIMAAPTLAAAEKALASFVFAEDGVLVPMGAGRYSLDGRTPDTKGPGAGLSTVQIMAVPFDTYLVLYLLPNVEVKEDSFLSNFPEEFRKHIKHEVRNPEKPKQAGIVGGAPAAVQVAAPSGE
jgi:hypothetical protein